MKIKLPPEVALALGAAFLVILFLAFGRSVARRIAARMPRKALLFTGAGLGAAFTVGGLAVAGTFYAETNARWLETSNVVLAAGLCAVGAAAFVWGTLRPVGAGLALLEGAALALKPVALPLQSDGHTFSLTSETHLYVLVPGLALAVVGILFAVTRGAPTPRAAAPLGPFASPVTLQTLGQAASARPTFRLVLAYQRSYAELKEDLVRLGWQWANESQTMPFLRGEPEWVVYVHPAGGQLHYDFNPVWRLREIAASGPPHVLEALRFLPQMQPAEVAALLQESQDERILLGMFAARSMGLSALAPRVWELTTHPREIVRNAAGKVAPALEGRPG